MRYCRRFLAGIPHLGVGTHVLLTRPPLPVSLRREDVRLACVRHAASVYPEPGSNSPSKMYIESLTQRLKCIVNELSPLTGSHCTLFIPYHSSVVQVLAMLPHLFAPLQLPAGASGILPRCLRAVKYFYCAFRNFILFRFTCQGGDKPGPYPVRFRQPLRSRVGAGLAPALVNAAPR